MLLIVVITILYIWNQLLIVEGIAWVSSKI